MKIITGVVLATICTFLMSINSYARENIIEMDFDSLAVDTQKLKEGNHDAISGMEISGLNTATVSESDTTTWAERTIAITEDPLSETATNDRVLKFTLNPNTYTRTIQCLQRINPCGKKSVYEFNIMYDGISQNHFLALQWIDDNGNYIEPHLLTVYKSSETLLKVHENKGGKDVKTFSPNEWVNFRVIMDCTATKDSGNGTLIPDFSKWTMKICVDGKMVAEFAFTDRGMTSLKQFVGVTYCFYGTDKAYSERNVYIDDVKCYIVEDSSVTEGYITSYNDSTFMYNSPVYLKTDTYIGSDDAQVNKVIYYDNGERIAESTTHPFELYYTPAYSGVHKITAKAYTDKDTNKPTIETSTTFTVEERYTEDVLMSQDFSDYVDGTTNWKDGNGTWCISGNGKGVEVDSEHGISLDMTGGTPDSVMVKTEINDGIYKFSGQYYFNNIDDAKRILTFTNYDVDEESFTLPNYADMGLVYADTDLLLQPLVEKRWYQFDVIANIKDGRGYYSLYIDGRYVMQLPFAENLKPIRRFCFLSLVDSGLEIMLDDLSISRIKYGIEEGFYCRGSKINAVEEMTDTILTAKTKLSNEMSGQQIIAVYDKENNSLKSVSFGEQNLVSEYFISGIEIADTKDIYVKRFVWDEMLPVKEVDNLN